MSEAPWPDEGFVVVKHDGTAWVIVHQNGHVLERSVGIGTDDPETARRWLRVQAIVHADTSWPADPGDDADVYALDRYDGRLVARPVGGFRHDERGWTLTDSSGRTTHVNADLGHDRYDDAIEWAHQIHAARPDYRLPGVRRGPRTAGTSTTTRRRIPHPADLHRPVR